MQRNDECRDTITEYVRLVLEGTNVHDATDKFRQKRIRDFREKITTLADDAPDVISLQDEQLDRVNARLSSVQEIPDKYVSVKKMRLAVPSLFKDDDLPLNATFFYIVSLQPKSITEPHVWSEMRRFASDNAPSIRRSMMDVEDEMKSIADDADSMKWLLNWRRYSQWGSVTRSVADYVKNCEDLLR